MNKKYVFYLTLAVILAFAGGMMGFFITHENTTAQKQPASPVTVSATQAPQASAAPTVRPKQTVAPPSETKMPSPSPEVKPASYLIKKQGTGTIGVFIKEGESDYTLLKTITVDWDNFRAEDKALLEKGITAQSNTQVEEILENFAN